MEEFSLRRLISSYNQMEPLHRPVAYMSFALNYSLGGLDVFGYHLVNIAIHIITGVGVYLLIKTIMEMSEVEYGGGKPKEGRLLAGLTAALWLVSPVQTQAVTYIVQRMASMAALFYIYSFFFYVKGRGLTGGKGAAFLSLSLAMFLLALGTKQNSLTLPFVIVLYELCFFKKRPSGFSGSLSTLVGITITAGFLYMNRGFLHLDTSFGWGYAIRERVFTEARVLIYYISIMLLPVPSKMALVHDFPISSGLLSPFSTLPALSLIIGIMAAPFLMVKKFPFASFFIFWFFLNILPESLSVGLDIVYEHRLYLPSVGFYAVIAYIMARMFELAWERRMKVPITVTALILIFFSVNTYARNMDWSDELSLWSDNVEKAPFIPKPHEALGMAYIRSVELDKAEREFRLAKSLDPLSSPASLGLAFVHFKRGESERAFSELAYIVERRKMGFGLRYEGVNAVFYEMGKELLKTGRREDAINVFRMGLQINSENSEIKEALMRLEKGEKWN